MSSNVLEGRGIVLRLEFSIADAVRERGLGSVLIAALRAWWSQRPDRHPQVPANLRADVGLPPEPENWFWPALSAHSLSLHPPDRSDT